MTIKLGRTWTLAAKLATWRLHLQRTMMMCPTLQERASGMSVDGDLHPQPIRPPLLGWEVAALTPCPCQLRAGCPPAPTKINVIVVPPGANVTTIKIANNVMLRSGVPTPP